MGRGAAGEGCELPPQQPAANGTALPEGRARGMRDGRGVELPRGHGPALPVGLPLAPRRRDAFLLCLSSSEVSGQCPINVQLVSRQCPVSVPSVSS